MSRQRRPIPAARYQATGCKVGEVTDRSAIVWTRLTLRAQHNPADGPMVEIEYSGSNKTAAKRGGKVARPVYPAGVTVADIRDAVPGSEGEVRVRYRPREASDWLDTDWQSVDPQRDYTRQFTLAGLQPKTRYQLLVESRQSGGGSPGQSLDGRFLTAPSPDDPWRGVHGHHRPGFPGQGRPEGYRIYPQMLQLEPSFFVHTGDILYYDTWPKTSTSPAGAGNEYSFPTNVKFHRHVAVISSRTTTTPGRTIVADPGEGGFMGDFTFAQGQAVFLEQVRLGNTRGARCAGAETCRSVAEGRDYRSPNNMPDGPDKTIWGAGQKEWFKETVQASDATFRVLVSPLRWSAPTVQKERQSCQPGVHPRRRRITPIHRRAEEHVRGVR